MAVRDEMVENMLAKLLRAVLTCGCIAYSDQLKSIGQTSFHIVITHGPLERVVGNHNVGTQFAKLLRVVLTCGCIAYSDQFKGLRHMSFPRVDHPQPLFNGCG